MKKILFSLLLPVLFLMLPGCSDDDDKDIMKNLEGTYFAAHAETTSYSTEYWGFRFLEAYKIEKTIRQSEPFGMILSTQTGTYSYNYPNIRISVGGQEYGGLFILDNVFRIKNENNRTMDFVHQDK